MKQLHFAFKDINCRIIVKVYKTLHSFQVAAAKAFPNPSNIGACCIELTGPSLTKIVVMLPPNANREQIVHECHHASSFLWAIGRRNNSFKSASKEEFLAYCSSGLAEFIFNWRRVDFDAKNISRRKLVYMYNYIRMAWADRKETGQ